MGHYFSDRRHLDYNITVEKFVCTADLDNVVSAKVLAGRLAAGQAGVEHVGHHHAEVAANCEQWASFPLSSVGTDNTWRAEGEKKRKWSKEEQNWSEYVSTPRLSEYVRSP